MKLFQIVKNNVSFANLTAEFKTDPSSSQMIDISIDFFVNSKEQLCLCFKVSSSLSGTGKPQYPWYWNENPGGSTALLNYINIYLSRGLCVTVCNTELSFIMGFQLKPTNCWFGSQMYMKTNVLIICSSPSLHFFMSEYFCLLKECEIRCRMYRY